jgi:LuxR family transcriptional regulator of csgAB operon
MFRYSGLLFDHVDASDTMKKKNDLLANLTKRENEVLIMVAKGMTRDEIANQLFLSPETIKMHTKNLYKKLNAKNKIDALIKAKMI